MPTIIANKIIFRKSDVTKSDFQKVIKDLITDGSNDNNFDFNKLIPEPKGLYMGGQISLNRIYGSLVYLKDTNKERYDDVVQALIDHNCYMRNDGIFSTSPQQPLHKILMNIEALPFRKGAVVDKVINSIIATGYIDWYEWRLLHWDTKWNASVTEIDENNLTISFENPWYAPQPIFVELYRKYNLPFDVTYLNDENEEMKFLHYPTEIVHHLTDITYADFKAKYQYVERVTSVSQDFEINDFDSFENDEAPEGDLIDTDYNVSESEYLLIDRASGYILIRTRHAYDIIEYISEELLLNVIK